MTTKQTLTFIVLAGALALGGADCNKSNLEEYPNLPNQSSAKPTGKPNSNNNAEVQTENNIKTPPKPEYQTISGEIVNIDEDYFPVMIISKESVNRGGGLGVGGISFPYELIRVKDKEGSLKQLLSPIPTGYQVGDKVNFSYIPLSSISFENLLNDYAKRGSDIPTLGLEYNRGKLSSITSVQIGTIKMDGIIKE